MTLALLLLACSNQEATEAARDEVIDAMEAHWDDAETMRDAAIVGDVDAYAKAAEALHDRLPLEGLPEELGPMEQQLKKAAWDARLATGPDDLGSTLGRVVAACGTCHEAADVRPLIEPTLPPPVKGAAPPAEMLWHQVAVAELWVSILRHDADAWSQGMDKVGKAVYVVDDGTAAGAAQDALEARLQAIAEKTRGADGTAARGEAFGRLVATCAACHAPPELAPEEGGEEGKPKKKKKGKKKKK